MTAIKVRPNHFSGLGRVATRDSDGLVAILRGALRDNANLKLASTGAAHAFTDNTSAPPTPMFPLLPLPSAAIDATTAGGAQTVALNASMVKIANAGKVAVNTLNAARAALGLPALVAASGTLATANTLAALDLTSTAANGAAAASYISALAAMQVVGANIQALVDGAMEVLQAVEETPIMFRVMQEKPGSRTLAVIPVVASVVAGPGALQKADADAFLAGAARDLAAMAYVWNDVVSRIAASRPLSAVAG